MQLYTVSQWSQMEVDTRYEALCSWLLSKEAGKATEGSYVLKQSSQSKTIDSWGYFSIGTYIDTQVATYVAINTVLSYVSTAFHHFSYEHYFALVYYNEQMVLIPLQPTKVLHKSTYNWSTYN